ncbi:MAG: GNAT family N-acetyltransferase [Acidihalobacter sp.]|uniref:GNAT family N-acetyltransferase n=1 Tax=Acidihalobacter sp. TaxID=1872108 RepID=UPI00307E33B7
MDFVLLADRPDELERVAGWYFEQWGYRRPGMTLADAREDLRDYLNRDKLPLMVLAVEGDELIGAAQLKYREMSIYPDREHWLGGVYVADGYRGRRIASKLVERIVALARAFRVETLHLQTVREDGGLYARLGWQAREQVHYKGDDVLVMSRDIGDRNP